MTGAAAGEVGADRRLRYVALGDSFTIGTSVAPEDAFPSQLVRAVPQLELVANLGVNGYSTVDLIRDELPAFERLAPGFATLLVGVNDVVQGIPPATYEADVRTILATLRRHLPVERYWLPEEFDALAREGRALGIAQVASGPLVRSSYHAQATFEAIRRPQAAPIQV